jgi:hypothetical protein
MKTILAALLALSCCQTYGQLDLFFLEFPIEVMDFMDETAIEQLEIDTLFVLTSSSKVHSENIDFDLSTYTFNQFGKVATKHWNDGKFFDIYQYDEKGSFIRIEKRDPIRSVLDGAYVRSFALGGDGSSQCSYFNQHGDVIEKVFTMGNDIVKIEFEYIKVILDDYPFRLISLINAADSDGELRTWTYTYSFKE